MKQLLLLLTCLITIPALAQDNHFIIGGIVVDSASGQPLQNASAYCTNTSYGTTTKADGSFSLRLPNGGYDLVVSYTGYDKKVMRISNNLQIDSLTIALTPVNNAMEEVAVVASNELRDGYERYGKFFIKQFIGTSPNAANCVLTNPEALRFFYTKKSNRLRVKAREDLQIINYGLGFKIRYQLDSFSYDYKTNISQFTGDPLFSEIDTTEEVMEQWKKNRIRTYMGSKLHFMRAYYDSVLPQQGFVIETIENEDAQEINPYDSSYFAFDSTHTAQVYLDGKYKVTYRPVAPDPVYLKEFKLPKDMIRQVTLLQVNEGFAIEPNGYFYEQYDVIFTGYWAWKKLAEMLPYDYPERK